MTKMLIADTHQVFLRSLRHFISSCHPDINVVTVPNEEMLMQRLIEESWDLVFCDIRLNRGRRIDQFREIKNMHPDTPLYIMGMFTRENVADRIRMTGADGYFMKDAIHEEMLILLEATLSAK